MEGRKEVRERKEVKERGRYKGMGNEATYMYNARASLCFLTRDGEGNRMLLVGNNCTNVTM